MIEVFVIRSSGYAETDSLIRKAAAFALKNPSVMSSLVDFQEEIGIEDGFIEIETRLKEEIEDLEEKKRDLEREIEDFEEKKQDLEREIEDFEEKKQDLEREIEDLEDKKLYREEQLSLF